MFLLLLVAIPTIHVLGTCNHRGRIFSNVKLVSTQKTVTQVSETENEFSLQLEKISHEYINLHSNA